MKFFSSTKIRLTFWYVGVLALILILFAVATYFLFDFVLKNQTDSTLAEIATSFKNTVKQDLKDEDYKNNGNIISEQIREATTEVSFRNYKIFVFSAENVLISEAKPTQNDTDIPNDTAQKWLTIFTQNGSANRDQYADDDEIFRVYYYPFQIKGRNFKLLVIHPLEETETLLERVRYAFLIIVPLALLFASLGGYLLVRKSLAPIEQMSEKAEEITARNLSERLPVGNGEDELGRLAKSFNRLLSRLNLSF